MTQPEAGAHADFSALYASTYGDVLRFVQRRCDPAGAQDVTAQTFLVAWRRYEELPAHESARRAWLFGTARRLLANDRRGEGRRAALAVRLAGAHDGVDPGAQPDLVAARLDLERAWPRLPPEYQEALAMAVWDDLTSAEAGAVLGISATAYRIRLSRARGALRTLLAVDAEPAADRLMQSEGEFR